MRYTTPSEFDKQEPDQYCGVSMALTQRLQMRQSQALVMTPQLMQAIKLLQLSNLDLAAYVEGSSKGIPLLERAAEGEPGVIDGAAEPVAAEFDGERDAPADIGGAGDRIDESLETSRSAIEERLGTDLENVFPDDASRAARRAPARTRPRRRPEWASVGSGGREDGDYNLEAFVSAAPTLADHLAEQLALAIADPVRRMIGQYLIDMVDEAGYLTGDLAAVAEKLGAPLGRGRGGARHRAGLRSARRVRAQSHRMPGDPAQGAQPLRSGDGGAGRPPRSAGQARSRRRCGASAASATRISPT